MERVYYIYYHIDPRTQFPVYIGKGVDERAYDFYGRNKEHVKWAQELKKEGLSPIVHIGNKFYSEDEAYFIEEEEISLFRKLGILLFNKAKGGRISIHEICEKPIICLNNEKIYASTKKASIDLDIGTKRINDILKGRKKSYRGYKFRYQDEVLNVVPDQIKESKSKRRKLSTSKPIICSETGEKFVSITAAANMLQVNNSAICAHLKGKVKKVKGLTFKRL